MENSAGGPERGTSERTESGRSSRHHSPPALLETLADRVPEPAMTLDGDMTVVGVNARLETAVGVPSSVILGEPLSWLFPSVNPEAVEESCDADESEAYVTSRCGPLDADRWFELTFDRHEWDEETYYFGLAREVTDQHERLQLLEQYERIIETIEDGVYTLDESFTIETVNSAVESMTGYSKDTLVGSSAMILTDESTIDEAATLASQILSGERTAGTLTTSLRTADGGELPIETQFTTYDLDDGFRQVGVVRDISDRKQFERTLADLHESTRKLLYAETKEAVADHIVQTALDVLELPAATIYLFDSSENVLRPTAGLKSIDVTDSEQCVVRPGSGLLWDVFVDDEAHEIDEDSTVELGGNVGTPDADGLCLPLDDHGVLYVQTGADQNGHVRELIDLLTASAQAAMKRVDRESALKDREMELRVRNSELQQLKQVNEIIRRIDRVLVDAETCESIEQAVCEQLVDSELFSFAWLGRRDDAELVPRAWAGETANYLDTLSLSMDLDDGPPAVRTARSETMTVVDSIADNLRDEHWRTEAISRDFQSAISVPLQYDEFVYGVLTVYADRPSTFGEMLQDVFTELGETIANAIREVESRTRQAADTVMELELSVSRTDSFVRQLATALDATVTCDGAVPHADDSTRLFLTIEDATERSVRTQAESMINVESVSTISGGEESGHYELIVTGPTIAGTVLDLAANLRLVRSTPTETTVVVHLTADVDVRTFVERFQQRYPEAQLTARREQTVTHQTRGGIRTALEEHLTDRQFEVLKTAYLSGFFEWPRESTGQDIATMLDVSQPTVNRHLRISERALLELVFDRI